MQFTYQNEIPEYITRTLKKGVRYGIEEVEDSRTLAQNRALWWWYYEEMIQAFRLKGYVMNKDQVHFFCKTLLPKKRKKCAYTGKFRYEERSTTKLSKKQFSDYIMKMKEFALHTLDYSIPDPRDDSDLEFYSSQM